MVCLKNRQWKFSRFPAGFLFILLSSFRENPSTGAEDSRHVLPAWVECKFCVAELAPVLL
ncbi:MAG: hypothetical protein A2018_04190 [Alphaproteobacteria bacterium GWF2_58_20]|nr:MAG: hypothetical protein A2018_04190 [Alphaproteobacteria bacterium GWF2_58_20]